MAVTMRPLPNPTSPSTSATLQLPHLPSADLDYAAGFRVLATVQAEIVRDGMTRERVLRRGAALLALGNYLGAAFDAERALRMDPTWSEASYLKGQAFLALAGVKHGVVRPGPGAYLPVKALPPRRHLLLTARQCLLAVLARGADPQATQALRACDDLLAALPAAAEPAAPVPTSALPGGP